MTAFFICSLYWYPQDLRHWTQDIERLTDILKSVLTEVHSVHFKGMRIETELSSDNISCATIHFYLQVIVIQDRYMICIFTFDFS